VVLPFSQVVDVKVCPDRRNQSVPLLRVQSNIKNSAKSSRYILLVKQVKQAVKQVKTWTYGLSAILRSDSVAASIPKIEVCCATYIFLRMGIGVVKEIRRTTIAARKASSWHKFGTGSYLLL